MRGHSSGRNRPEIYCFDSTLVCLENPETVGMVKYWNAIQNKHFT